MAFRAASCSVSGRTVLSLFDYSGNWSRPYKEAGAKVLRVDIKRGMDVMDIDKGWLESVGRVDAILAAPPCTDFCVSGAQYWRVKDESGETAKSLALVRKVLWCVEICSPDWWVMENPAGRLNALMPELARFGPWYFHPCDYGDAYKKRTGLWGEYMRPLPLFVGGDHSVRPVPAKDSWLQKLGSKSETTKARRSVTPLGFAYSFFLANCWGAYR